MRREPDWRDQSACQNDDPQRFFADRGRLPDNTVSLCHRCPVREECLTFAVESPWEPYGVWGGKQAKDIRPLWRQRHPMHAQEVQQLLGTGREPK